MKVTADTNVLVRILTRDDRQQSSLAEAALARAELIALTLPALCELVWVLSRGYRLPTPDIAAAIRRLLGTANVTIDRPATEAGLAALEAGGDFADGVIAYEGERLGAEIFLSFDRKAVTLLQMQGRTARHLA